MTEILDEIAAEGNKELKQWSAAFGFDQETHSYDLYILNPVIGVYQIKMDHKNPYELRGVGGRIARRVDEEISPPGNDRFGIIRQNPRKIVESMKMGIPLHKILEEAMIFNREGHGIEVPVKGPLDTSDASISKLRAAFQDEMECISEEFEKVVEEDGAYKSYA